ncbi:MAG: FixG Ig-like domain-containing protein, partial [Akkermansiaceae bacterium]
KVRPFHAQANKVRGIAFQTDDAGVRNVYEIHLMNKRTETDSFTITLLDAPEWIQTSGTTEGIALDEMEEKTYNLVVIAPAKKY